MSLHKKNGGARVTTATIGDVTDPAPNTDPLLVLTEDLVERAEFPGGGGSDKTADTKDDRVTLAFRTGDVVRQSALLAKISAATISSVTPATGPAAGGTSVTIKGTGLDGVTAVDFGGAAATAVVVVDPRTVTCTTPARTAGAKTVSVTDDGGAASKATAFTYV